MKKIVIFEGWADFFGDEGTPEEYTGTLNHIITLEECEKYASQGYQIIL